MPEPPAAAKMMSAPASYMPFAVSVPAAGSLKPLQSGGFDRYLTWTLMSGLTALAPAVKPASNFCRSGMRQPPM